MQVLIKNLINKTKLILSATATAPAAIRILQVKQDTMPFGSFLKKEKHSELPQNFPQPPPIPVEPEFQFTFMRSDTHTQEIISPPTFSSPDSSNLLSLATDGAGERESRTSRLFGRPRTTSAAESVASASSRGSEKSDTKSAGKKRLSQRLGLRRSEQSSTNVPVNLPEITPVETTDVTTIESQWEARATILARKNEIERSRPNTPVGSMTDLTEAWKERFVSSKRDDDAIQEAIRLHEAGDLEASTQMFGRLADPNGENNALSQVLYGLALRYVNWSPVMQPRSQMACSPS